MTIDHVAENNSGDLCLWFPNIDGCVIVCKGHSLASEVSDGLYRDPPSPNIGEDAGVTTVVVY
jgi:hypothetical protein